MAAALDILVIFLLIVLNGLFAMSEMALASSNRSRLGILEAQGVRGRPGRAGWPRTRSASCRPCRWASR